MVQYVRTCFILLVPVSGKHKGDFVMKVVSIMYIIIRMFVCVHVVCVVYLCVLFCL